MSHYRLSDSMPSAIILARNPRTSSLDELKTYRENNIFLNDKDEFQIRLFNPLTEKIGVQVSVNGKKSDDLLVLNPGEDVIVDRFIDDQRRMIFETYKYDDNNTDAKKAVAKNGLIEINFFKEYQNQLLYTSINPWSSTVNYNLGYSTLTNISMGTVTIGTNSIGGSNGNTGPAGTADTGGGVGISNNPDGTITTADGTYSSPNFKSPGVYVNEPDLSNISLTFASDFDPKNRNSRIYDNDGLKLSKSLKETGRVEKGSASDQKFESVNIKFNTFSFHSIVFKLNPMSEKNSQIKEIRDYCEICRHRIRNNKWVYCPKCGNKLD